MSRATDRLGSDKRAWFGVGVIVLLVVMAVAVVILVPLHCRYRCHGGGCDGCFELLCDRFV